MGRAAELELLSDLYAGASRERVVVIHGEAGVGKTQLVSEMSRRATAAGALVVRGRAHRFGADSSPYLPLLAALRELDSKRRPDELPELEPLIAAVEAEVRTNEDAGAYSGRLVREIGRAFTKAAASRPLAVVIDDVQWADPTTMEVLAFLADGYDSDQLSIVIVYRDEGLPDGHPLHSWLVDLRKALPVRMLPLARLNFDETTDQVVALLGTAELGRAAELFERSAGNPYLTELLCAAYSVEASGDHKAPDVGSALREVLLSAWHRLPHLAREVARALSIAGRPGKIEVFTRVATTLGASEREIEVALREGVLSGLLVWEPTGVIWFRHPLTAEILESTLLPDESARLHRAFAAELEGHPQDGQALADRALHLAAAGEPDAAFELCLAASAREQERGSTQEAANLLRRAIELWPQVSSSMRPPGRSLCALYVELADLLLHLGDFPAGVDAIDRACELRDEQGDPLTAGHALTVRSQLHRYAGVPEPPGLPEITHAVELSAAEPSDAVHVKALAEEAELLRYAGESEKALQVAEQAIHATATSSDPWARTWALTARLNVAPNVADREEIRAIATTTGSVLISSLDRQQAGFALLNAGDWPGCVEEFSAGFETTTRGGLLASAQILGAYLAQFQIALGQVPEAREALRLVLASRPHGFSGVVAHSQALVIAVRAGDEERAQLHLRWLGELVEAFVDMVGVWGPTVLAEYLIDQGKPQAALDVLRERVVEHGRFEPMYGDLMVMWAARATHDLCQRARDAREPEGVERALSELDDVLHARNRVAPRAFELTDNPVSGAARATFEASRASCVQAPDTAELWQLASEMATKAGLRYDAALALTEEASLLLARRGNGARPVAKARLNEAHRITGDIEAFRLRTRIEELARAARLSLAHPGDRLEPARLPDGITRREVEVLGLLAAGRSYAEIASALFISQKTVSAHISNLLRKTGTGSRSEAVAWARRHHLVDD